MIASDSAGNCVARALSTMRLALGYADGVPAAFADDPPGGKDDVWILENAPTWFPDRAVLVWCAESATGLVGDSSAYAGTVVPGDFDYDAHLMAFSICGNPDDDEGDYWHHLVVGSPGRFNAAGPSVILAVSIEAAPPPAQLPMAL